MGIDDVQPVRLWQSVEAPRAASSKGREGELRRRGQGESVVTEAGEYIKSTRGGRHGEDKIVTDLHLSNRAEYSL